MHETRAWYPYSSMLYAATTLKVYTQRMALGNVVTSLLTCRMPNVYASTLDKEVINADNQE